MSDLGLLPIIQVRSRTSPNFSTTLVIGGGVLFGDNFDGGEVFLQARALDFAELLGDVALGDHEEAVPLRQVGERLGDIGEKFHGMLGDLVGDAANRLVKLRRDRFDGKLLETDHQGFGEAVHAVSVLADVLALDVVEHVANFIGRVVVMVEERDEIGNRPLEVNIVFPKGVVGVDEQVLAGSEFSGGAMRAYWYFTEEGDAAAQ